MRYLRTILAVNICLIGLAWPDALSLFRDNQSPVGGWETASSLYDGGAGDSLIIWASLKNNVSPQSPWLSKAADHLKSALPKTTFARAMRIMALSGDPTFADKTVMAEDTKWLSDSQSPEGGWGSGVANQPNKLNTLDTAWAILALDRAKACRVEVSPAVFTRAINFFQAAINSDDGYGYDWPKARPDRLRGQSHALTTAAAIVALDVIAKNADADTDQAQALADKARQWLGGNDSPVKIAKWYWGSQPLGQYRFFLSRATVDKQAVSDAILASQDKDKCAPTNGLAEDKLIATAWAALTLPENSAPQTGPAEKQPVAAIPTALPNILRKISIAAWPQKNNYALQASVILTDELRDAYSLGADCVTMASLKELEGKDTQVLWCTTCPKEINSQQQMQLLRFISSGGMALFDSQTDAEYESAEAALRNMFGDEAFQAVTVSMPLLTGNFAGGVGLDVTDKLASVKELSRPLLMAVVHKDKTVAIISAVPLAKIASGNFPKEPPMQPALAKEILLNILLFADTQTVSK